MKCVVKTYYEDIAGNQHENPLDALFEDFRVLRQDLVDKSKFLSVQREEQQFWDLKIRMRALFEKYQEFKEFESPEWEKRRGKQYAMGKISQERIERPYQHTRTLKKAA